MNKSTKEDKVAGGELRSQQLQAMWSSFESSGAIALSDASARQGAAGVLHWLASGGLDLLKLRSLAMGSDLGDIDPQLLLLRYLSDELRERSVEKG